MRRYLLLLLLTATPLLATWGNGYTWRRALTINSGQVPSSQSGFPVLVCFNGSSAPCNDSSLAAADLRTTGNGGVVANTVYCCTGQKDVSGSATLAIDAVDNTKVSSTFYSFTSGDDLKQLCLTLGTGWTVGCYTIISTSSGAATLSSSPSAAGNLNVGTFDLYKAIVLAPADVIFTSDSAGSNLLTWDVEKYVAATGECVFWVNTTAATGTTIYMFYGKSATKAFQSNYTLTWYGGYVGVWHFRDGTTLNADDSTGNGNNGAALGAVSAAAGQIDGGVSNAGAGAILLTSSSSLNITGDITMSAWINPTDTAGYDIVLGYASGVYTGYAFQLYAANLIRFYTDSAGWVNSNTVSDLRFAWHYVTVSLSGSTASFYVDGVSQGSAVSAPGSSWSGDRYIASDWRGSMDEVRLSNVSRSADRVAAEYNNQSAPASFWAAGGATSQSGSGGRERVQVILFGQ
jgi:Concanavalin A-like lectin/glucanases superfamily